MTEQRTPSASGQSTPYLRATNDTGADRSPGAWTGGSASQASS